MNAAIRAGLLSGLLALTTPVLAQDDLADLKDLEDEPSRTQLFALVRAVAEAEDPPASDLQRREFSLAGPFGFPNDVITDSSTNQPRTDAIFGVDISHYTDSSFPIARLRDKRVRFVFVKASQGTTNKDGKFAMFWKALGELPANHRVHRGAYHFLSASTDGAAQAATFLRVLNANGGTVARDMPPVVDLEWDNDRDGHDRWAGKSADEIVASAKAWLQAVEQATGRKPMIYTAQAWWKPRLGDARVADFAGYPIWIADYSKASRAAEVPRMMRNATPAAWQFTDSAKMDQGFTAGFDASVFKGSEAKFYETFGIAQP